MFPRPPDLPAPLQPSQPAPTHLAELDRLGDQIAELSAHLEAATARLLTLIRNSTPAAAGRMASAPAPSGSRGA
jgi:hypothetical protein